MELDQLTVLLILSDPNFYEWMAGIIAQQSGLQVTAEQCLQYVQLAAQSGDQLAQQLIMQYILAYTLVRSAAAGTKLDYISRLRGKCPAGYQMLYYKQGGRVCKKCVKKKATGGVMSKDFTVGTTGENAVNAFKRAYSYRQGGAVTKYLQPAGPITVENIPIIGDVVGPLVRLGKNIKLRLAGEPIHPESTTVILGGDIVNGAVMPEGYRKTVYTDPNGNEFVEEIVPKGLNHDWRYIQKLEDASIHPSVAFDRIVDPEDVDSLYSYPYGIAGYDFNINWPHQVLTRAGSFYDRKNNRYYNIKYPMIRDLVRKEIYGK